MRKFVLPTPDILTKAGWMFDPSRGKILLTGLLVYLFCFQSFGQDKSSKARESVKVKPHSADQVPVPYKPAVEKDVQSNAPLARNSEGYLILVKQANNTEEVLVPFKGAKMLAVNGNSKVSVLKFDDLKTMKHWAPAYRTDFKVISSDKKSLVNKLSSLGATLSTK